MTQRHGVATAGRQFNPKLRGCKAFGQTKLPFQFLKITKREAEIDRPGLIVQPLGEIERALTGRVPAAERQTDAAFEPIHLAQSLHKDQLQRKTTPRHLSQLGALHAQARHAVFRRDDRAVELQFLLTNLHRRLQFGQRGVDLAVRLTIDVGRGFQQRDALAQRLVLATQFGKLAILRAALLTHGRAVVASLPRAKFEQTPAGGQQRHDGQHAQLNPPVWRRLAPYDQRPTHNGCALLSFTPRNVAEATVLLVKALHLIFMVTWFAGLFYLPRLFVYHAASTDDISLDRFAIMERRLFVLMTLGAVLTTIFGLWLIIGQPSLLSQGWLHAKLALVALLIGYHAWCWRLHRQLARGVDRHSPAWFRGFNEVPTVALVGIVLLAVLRPF